MNSFNPSKYSSSYSESVDVSDEIVEKGHKNVLQVDLEKFEEICKKFKDNQDMKIKNLTGTYKEDFDLVVNYVHLLYGTSYYTALFEKVKKHFKNASGKAGTVGGYFSGCLKSKDGCSLSCAGSMPLPKDEEGWSQCDKAVIMAERSGENYSFSIVKPGNSEEDMNPAYVFVESDFEGFNQHEKENLKSMGCKKVKLIGYSSDMNYSELETSSVEKLKTRKRKVVHHKSDKDENNNWFIFGVVIFLILLLIFCLLMYKYKNM